MAEYEGDDRDLERRTGRRVERLPEFEPGTGVREGDAPRRLYDPTDPRRP